MTDNIDNLKQLNEKYLKEKQNIENKNIYIE